VTSILDVIVIVLFVLFMIFIFKGYHHQKYLERLEEAKRQDEEKNSDD